jgi:hypothetical protein
MALDSEARKRLNEMWHRYNLPSSPTCGALGECKQFLVEMDRIVSSDAKLSVDNDGPKWVPESDEDFAEYFAEKDACRAVHDYVLTPLTMYSAVLLIYSVFEHELIRVAEKIGGQGAMGKPSGSILKPAVECFLRDAKIDIKQLVLWDYIPRIESIRHCIVHCYGNPSYLNTNSKKRFDEAVKALSPMVVIRYEDKVEIDAQACRAFLFIIARWYRDLFEHLNWEIDEQRWDQLVVDLIPSA